MKYTGKAKGVGAIIQRLRGERGLTQMGLAKKAKLSWSHVNHIENGGRKMTDAVRLKLARALQVNPDKLIVRSYKIVLSGPSPKPFEIEVVGDSLSDVIAVGRDALDALSTLAEVTA